MDHKEVQEENTTGMQEIEKKNVQNLETNACIYSLLRVERIQSMITFQIC